MAEAIKKPAYNSFYLEPAQIVTDLQVLVYEIGIVVNFDWMSWKEGGEILSASDYNYNSLDLTTLCKLLTVIVRNDRFCDGYLALKLKDGTMYKLIKALELCVKN